MRTHEIVCHQLNVKDHGDGIEHQHMNREDNNDSKDHTQADDRILEGGGLQPRSICA
jgi:hypothetical protein